jgi:hypothetical protein
VVNRIDATRPGRREGGPDRRPWPRSSTTAGTDQPVLLASTVPTTVSTTEPTAAPARDAASDASVVRVGDQRSSPDPVTRRALAPVVAAPRAIPAGWPAKQASPVWAWLAQQRAPVPILIAGAEGGVGVSTVTALLADTLAAGSPGPTVVLDQCGSAWGSLSRRLVGHRGGMPADHARALLGQGVPTARVLGQAPATSAGAVVLTDTAGYTPLREVFRTVQTVCGALVVDAGPVNLLLSLRLDLRPVVVLVGRADVVGAEAVCAAAGFLAHRAPGVRPLVVLASPNPIDRRRVRAGRTLVAAAGIAEQIELPFDPRLASSQPLRLDQVARTTALACLRLVRSVATSQQEVPNHAH